MAANSSPTYPPPRTTRRAGRSVLASRSVLVATTALSRSPGMSGMIGWAPVLTTTCSAVTVTVLPPSAIVTCRVCGSTNRACPVITVTESMPSSMAKFSARSSDVRACSMDTACR